MVSEKMTGINPPLFLAMSTSELHEDRVNQSTKIQSIQANNSDEILLKRVVKDLQLAREKYEDMMRQLHTLQQKVMP